MTLPLSSNNSKLLEEVADETDVVDSGEAEGDLLADGGLPGSAENSLVDGLEALGRDGRLVAGDEAEDAEVGPADEADAGAQRLGGHEQLEVRGGAVDDGWGVVHVAGAAADGEDGG